MAEKRQRGGSRKGKPNRASAARERATAATGILPMEQMIRRMRYHHTRAMNLLAKAPQIETDPYCVIEPPKVVEPPKEGEAPAAPPLDLKMLKAEIERELELANDSAKDAAQFVHPKLSSVDKTNTNKIDLDSLSDEDFNALGRIIARNNRAASELGRVREVEAEAGSEEGSASRH